MAKILTFLLLSAFPALLFGQLETSTDWKRQVYDTEFTGGIMFHTRGYGINFRYLKYKDGFKKFGFEYGFVSIKHPKEVKFPSQLYFNAAKSFVYGKLNGLYSIRVGYGRDKVLIDKTDQGSISISWATFGGASFGFLKPVYLEILTETPQGIQVLSTERYNPEVHDYAQIYGQAPFFQGIENSSLRMGVYAKTGFVFDYNWSDQKITSLELGAVIDYFPTWFGLYSDEKVPIMYEAQNYNLWLQFYLTVNFGRKWN